MRTFIRTFPILVLIYCWNADLWCQPAANKSSIAPSVLGTWKGESICVGNRPTCKNEVVVYRFAAVAGKRDVVLQLADKIIAGKREPMGKLEFKYDGANKELSCEFTIRQTHGVWRFQVSGDSMEGTLVLLPNKEVVRRVKVKRVVEREVPAAPTKEAYEGSQG